MSENGWFSVLLSGALIFGLLMGHLGTVELKKFEYESVYKKGQADGLEQGFRKGQKDGLKRCEKICNVKFKF